MAFCVTLFDTIVDSSNDACFATATHNLTINKGSSYKIIYKLSKNNLPVNLTGYSLSGAIKPSISSDITLLEMNSGNLLLNIDNDNSQIIMVLKESFTRRVSQSLGIYYIELINPLAEVSKIVSGTMTFVPEAA